MTVFDPDTDLILERQIAAPPSSVWRCWTDPELLKQWFCPPPYSVVEVEIDPQPGGIFRTVMAGPDGQSFEEPAGCILRAEIDRFLSFTDALAPGFRPRSSGFMTALISFEPIGTGTHYTAHVCHGSPQDRKRHEDMGFFDGWGTVTDQLGHLAQSLKN